MESDAACGLSPPLCFLTHGHQAGEKKEQANGAGHQPRGWHQRLVDQSSHTICNKYPRAAEPKQHQHRQGSSSSSTATTTSEAHHPSHHHHHKQQQGRRQEQQQRSCRFSKQLIQMLVGNGYLESHCLPYGHSYSLRRKHQAESGARKSHKPTEKSPFSLHASPDRHDDHDGHARKLSPRVHRMRQ